MKVKRKNISAWITILCLVTGLSILLYPTLSNYVNQMHSSRSVTIYKETVDQLNEERLDQLWEEAQIYNLQLSQKTQKYHLNGSEQAYYEVMLNVDGDGMMGWVEIPTINVKLPIYHGSSASVLQNAVGHLEWTSLPVGKPEGFAVDDDPGSHCVLSGHRGLPSADLFTDLDQVQIGDRFTLTILGRELVYEVDQILVVKPEETEDLKIVPGEDLCTLMTCTPYGINTHRLLVRGHRVEEREGEAE